LAEFCPDEPLYLRYGSDDFVAGTLDVSVLHFPRASVNRGRLSEPEDALFSETGEYNGLGVIELRVSDLPETIAQPQGPAYTFYMEHTPLDDNYSHSEICSEQAPCTGRLRTPSKTVKMRFRIEVSRMLTAERIRIAAVRARIAHNPTTARFWASSRVSFDRLARFLREAELDTRQAPAVFSSTHISGPTGATPGCGT
jgi:hypothetical protein